MARKVSLENTYAISEDVVAREIEGELIIVPLVAGIGDLEDELFTLNDTGRAIWARLDGQRSLQEVVRELSDQYQAGPEEIAADVLGLVGELLRRRMVVEITST
jgi:hypothetical protein